MKTINVIEKLGAGGLVALSLAFSLQPSAWAGFTEPPNELYGLIMIDGRLVTDADTDVVVEARRMPVAPAIASYRMGDWPNPDHFYDLRLPVETVTPVSDANASVAGAVVYLVVLKNGQVRDQLAYTVGERGAVRRLDFGAVDTDNDQLPDGWEQLYFMDTGQTATADPDNDGWNNLREFREGTHPLRADARHPADLNPPDNRITIAELAEYYAAWKRAGAAWSVPPSPIPQAYVTRGSFIWEGGEYYKFDTNYAYPPIPPTLERPTPWTFDGTPEWWAAAQPVWWVNTPAPSPQSVEPDDRPQVAKMDASSGRGQVGKAGTTEALLAVEAVLPGHFAPGQPITVVNRVSLQPGLRAYTVEGFLPSGWTLGQVSHSGNYDPVNRKIKWGPYFDRRARDLSYELAPAQTTAGLVEISGRASYDGFYVEIGGPKSVANSLAAVFAPLPEGANGILEWVIDGYPGREYRLEASTDLREWMLLLTGAAGPDGKLRFQDPAGSAQPYRFYRAVSVE